MSKQDDITANYTIDLMRNGSQLLGSGAVNGNHFAEVADLDGGTLNWKSALALRPSNLLMEVRGDEQTVTLRGALGGVETDLRDRP